MKHTAHDTRRGGERHGSGHLEKLERAYHATYGGRDSAN